MQTIIGVTRSQKRTTTEYEEALDDLDEETSRLRSLTEDLLLLARGEQPTVKQKESVNLSSFLEDVVESLTPLAEAKGLAMECRVAPNIMVNSDRDGLIRLFVNLVDNAIKFTATGEVTVTATIESRDIQIEIADTGKGIPTEQLSHIFDRFYRVDSSRTQTGAGLGLAIALQIARSHGGDITVQSKVGEGTAFFVTLPTL